MLADIFLRIVNLQDRCAHTHTYIAQNRKGEESKIFYKVHNHNRTYKPRQAYDTLLAS